MCVPDKHPKGHDDEHQHRLAQSDQFEGIEQCDARISPMLSSTEMPTVELEEIMSGADFANRILDVVDADDLDSAAVEASLEIDTDQTNEIDSACWDWIDKTLGIKDGKTHPQQAIDFHERMSQEVANRMRSDSECSIRGSISVIHET